MDNTKLRCRDYSLNAIGLILLLFSLSLSIVSQSTLGQIQTSNNSLFPPSSKPYGSTYGDWTAKWWQWAYSIPKERNPITDTSGANCAQGQKGPVWFLAGTTGGPAERTCNIPAGKAVLFPVVAAECSYAEYPQLKTEQQLRSCAASQEDHVTLQASVDGTNIQGLQGYRAQSPLFNFTVPKNNIVGISTDSSNNTQGVSNGYWVFLKPVTAGSHTVHFSGVSTTYAATGVNTYSTEVKYHLTVP
jgi:hypothetical protein